MEATETPSTFFSQGQIFIARTKKSMGSCKSPINFSIPSSEQRNNFSVEEKDLLVSLLSAWFILHIFHGITHSKTNLKRKVAYSQNRLAILDQKNIITILRYLPRIKYSTVWILANSASFFTFTISIVPVFHLCP